MKINKCLNLIIAIFALDLIIVQSIICFLYNLKEVISESINYKLSLYSFQGKKGVFCFFFNLKDQGNSEARRVAGTAEEEWEEAGFWQNGMC